MSFKTKKTILWCITLLLSAITIVAHYSNPSHSHAMSAFITMTSFSGLLFLGIITKMNIDHMRQEAKIPTLINPVTVGSQV